MSETGLPVATWVSALAATMSSVAALASLYVAFTQTRVSIAEKDVRAKVEFPDDGTLKAVKFNVIGSSQYVRDLDISEGNVLEYTFRTEENGHYLFGPRRYFKLQTGSDNCTQSNASANSVLATCNLDLDTYYRYRHYFKTLAAMYPECVARGQTLITLVYKYVRVDYDDLLNNKRSEFILIDPNTKFANSAVPRGGDEESFDSDSAAFDLINGDSGNDEADNEADDYDDTFNNEKSAMVSDDATLFVKKLVTCDILSKKRRHMGARILSKYLNSDLVSKVVQ